MKINDLKAIVDRLVNSGHGEEHFSIFDNEECAFVTNAAIVIDDLSDNANGDETYSSPDIPVIFNSKL